MKPLKNIMVRMATPSLLPKSLALNLPDPGEPITVKTTHPYPDGCPECGAPAGSPGYLRNDVPVGHPNFGKISPCSTCHGFKQEQRQQQRSQMEGWLPQASFKNYRPTLTNQAAYAAAQAFVQQPQGWLTLWGNYGTGKTHLLAAIINESHAQGLMARYYTWPNLLDQLRQRYTFNDYSPWFERLCTLPILALDEIDKVRRTPWADEKIYQLADARYRNLGQLGTIFALNADPRQLLQEVEEQSLKYLFSRMLDGRSQLIHLDGPDARPLAQQLWAAAEVGP